MSSITLPQNEDLAQIISRRDESSAAMAEAQRAFEELYRRHSPRLLAFLSSRIHRNDLEDVHQEIWQRVWERIPTAFRGGNFRVWLFHISRNYVIDVGRKKKSSPMGDADESIVAAGPGPEENSTTAEQMTVLAECLQEIEGTAADVLKRRLRGESYAEICSGLSITPASAHKLLFRAKAAMSRRLQECYA